MMAVLPSEPRRGSPVDGGGPVDPGVDVLWLFSVLWALAAWFHLMGNTRGELDPSHVVLAAAAALVLARPGSIPPLVALASAGFWTAWDEAPMLSNHWFLFCLVNVSLLASIVVGGAKARNGDHDLVAGTTATFVPVARTVLLAFYLFAAFAKLNSAFFDRSVSCAVFFLDESLTSLGLDGLGLHRSGSIQWLVIFATAGIELSVPWLLMIRRTRNVGVVVAVVFHGLLALDKSTHQFVDFTSLLMPLFLLFLPVGFATWVKRGVTDGLRSVRPEIVGTAVAAVVLLSGIAAESNRPNVTASRSLIWWVWQPLIIATAAMVIRYLRSERREPISSVIGHEGKRPPAWLWMIPALTALNGLTPYFEVKTAYGWNMYSNLRVVDGDSNHFLFRVGLPLTDEQSDVVIIKSSSDPRLQFYVTIEQALPRTELRIFVADNPDVALTYEHGGEEFVTARAGDDPLLNEPVSLWRSKVQVFRSISLTQPEACLPLWGAAR